VQVSTCLVDAYEDHNRFVEVSLLSIFVMSEVSIWNKEQRLSFVYKLKKTATETFEMLKSPYGEECLLRKVFE
jgi:hypothetical protein